MKQFAIALVYSLVGLTFLFATFASINETGTDNKKSADEFQITKPLSFTSETTISTEMEVSADDIQTMRQKVNFAQSVLEEFWNNEFAGNGIRFRSPNVRIFEGATNSACGSMSTANYCSYDHTIYLNSYFLYSQMEMVSRRLGSDGDMAAIVIIGHEYGHSVQAQVPLFRGYLELNADCMAGAFTRYSGQKGVLDSDDIPEARYGLYMNPEYSVYWNRHSHGTSQERVAAFDIGLFYGTARCTER